MRGDVFSKWRNAQMMLSRWKSVVSFMPQLWYEVPTTLWIGGRMGPRIDMDAVVKRKSFDTDRI
jgi:hypothetical protein